MNRFRYRLNTRRYQMRRDNTLRIARLRYRLDNMAMGGALKIGLLVLLGATPFVLYFLLQPDTPTAVEDPVSNISRNTNPPAPVVVPFTPSPTPSIEPSPTPSASPSPSPSPSPTPAAQCSNRKDDDKDGRTDFPTDKGCSSRTDRSESPDPSPTPPPPAPAPAPLSPPPPTPPAEAIPQCRDGLNNDGDSAPDYPLDLGCTSADDNDESGPAPSPTPSESPTPSPTPSETVSAPRTLQLPPEVDSLLPGTVGPLI